MIKKQNYRPLAKRGKRAGDEDNLLAWMMNKTDSTYDPRTDYTVQFTPTTEDRGYQAIGLPNVPTYGSRVKYPSGGVYNRRFPAGRKSPAMNWYRGGYQQFGNSATYNNKVPTNFIQVPEQQIWANHFGEPPIPTPPTPPAPPELPAGWSVIPSPEQPRYFYEHREPLDWLNYTKPKKTIGELGLLALQSIASRSPYALLGYGALNSREPAYDDAGYKIDPYTGKREDSWYNAKVAEKEKRANDVENALLAGFQAGATAANKTDFEISKLSDYYRNNSTIGKTLDKLYTDIGSMFPVISNGKLTPPKETGKVIVNVGTTDKDTDSADKLKTYNDSVANRNKPATPAKASQPQQQTNQTNIPIDTTSVKKIAPKDTTTAVANKVARPDTITKADASATKPATPAKVDSTAMQTAKTPAPTQKAKEETKPAVRKESAESPKSNNTINTKVTVGNETSIGKNADYTVVKGDSPWAIANKAGISLNTLYELNPEMEKRGVYVGDKVNLSRNITSDQTIYKAVANDSPWKIAHDHGMTLDEFYKLNPRAKYDKNKKWTGVYVGDEFVVTNRSKQRNGGDIRRRLNAISNKVKQTHANYVIDNVGNPIPVVNSLEQNIIPQSDFINVRREIAKRYYDPIKDSQALNPTLGFTLTKLGYAAPIKYNSAINDLSYRLNNRRRDGNIRRRLESAGNLSY